jgi:hypothetical protein
MKKKEVIKSIRIMGVGTTEILMDFNLNVGIFNSIEWIPKTNRVVLHMFSDFSDFELSVDWEDLSLDDQLEVYIIINSILYN